MFKVFLVLTLALVASVAAQEGPQEAAAEPYSYGYQTDSHAASEQRDPQGRVTGFYTLTDADGRERKVEYTADESGFHAKVATNEVGTKSENSADVEIQASEPSQGQYFASTSQYQQSPPPPAAFQSGQQITQQRITSGPTVATFQQQQPSVYRAQTQYVQQQQPSYYRSRTQYVQGQPQTVGYYPGGYAAQYGAGYGNIGYGHDGFGRAGYSSYGAHGHGQAVGNYNNHLPSQYYRSIQTSQYSNPGYSGGYNYVSQPGSVTTATGYRTVSGGGPVQYSVQPGTVTTRTVSSTGSQGSSNYLVLQKRAANKQ